MPASEGVVFSNAICAPCVPPGAACSPFAADVRLATRFYVQPVAAIDQHKSRLQQVVAIGTPAHDVQKQIEFGGRWQLVKSGHGRWEAKGSGWRLNILALNGFYASSNLPEKLLNA